MTAEPLLRTPTRADPGPLTLGVSILLATDESEAARAGEEWIRRLRWARRPVVDVVTVAPRPRWPAGIGAQTYRPAVREAVDHGREARLVEAQRVANAAASRLQHDGMLVRVWARGGEPADEIVRASRLDPIELIVVGRAGRAPHGIFGRRSVSREVARHADAPVLIAHAPPSGATPLPRSIAIVDVDDTATAAALRWLRRTGWLDGARVTLARLPRGGGASGTVGDHSLAGSDVPSTVVAVTLPSDRGRPVEALASFTREAAVDLLVVARTRGGREADLGMEIGDAAGVSVLLTAATPERP